MAKKLFQTRENPALYEINTVAWLFELSRKMGKRITLGEVPSEEWDSLSRLGIELVWLMGVWKRSKTGRTIALYNAELRKVYNSTLPGWTEEDVIGSSYSVSAFTPDPSIGKWEDIDTARTELHRHGIGLILDFIPNHTGIDHHWIEEHPEYYVQGSKEDYQRDPSAFLRTRYKGRALYLAKGRDPYFPPWSDTVQLNYLSSGLHTAMIRELVQISRHCDGIRCDMAMLVLSDIFNKTWGWATKSSIYQPPDGEFWTQALHHAPGLIWIAEAYWDTERRFQELGFDYVYDKKLYDLFRWSSPQDVRNYLESTAYPQKLMRFLENHDEERAMKVFGKDRLVANATLFSTLPGMKLYHHGQFDGKKVRLPLQLRQAVAEPPDLETRTLYEKIMRIAAQDVFHRGVWQIADILPAWDDSFRNLLAYHWRLDEQTKLVVVNLSQNWSQGRIQLSHLDEDRDYTLLDELNDKTYIRSGREMTGSGLHVILEGYQAHVFDIA